MNDVDLKTLVELGESESLEFKASTTSLESAMRTVCAFLNSKRGGVVLFGVSDKGRIVGQDVSDKTQKTIAYERDKIEPYPDIEISYLPVETGKTVIAIIVKPGANGPYFYETRAFSRNQSTTRMMTLEEQNRLIHNKAPAWENLTTNNCTIDDLDENRIRQVVRTAVAEKRMPEVAIHESIDEVLTKLEILSDGRLTNAAVILFCKNEYKQFMQSSLKLARFDGINKREFIDNKNLRGNAFDLYESAIAFLRNYLPIGGRIEEGNPFRIDTPAIPYKVLREGLVNAFCHRDYSFQGGSIDVAIYDDRVEIVSSGPLPPNIQLSDLSKQHKSYPRNPRIAHVFFLCRMIERWGRGTLEMVEVCQASGNPIPQFEETVGSFSVILPLKEPIKRATFPQTSSDQLTPIQSEILTALQQGPMSREKIMGMIKAKLADRTVQQELLKLKKLGLIASEGKGPSVVWASKKK